MYFLVLSLSALAQGKVSWDSTARPNVYNMLVERFRNFPPDRSDIVFLGNSITFWGDWKERLKDCGVKNQGIPGDITFGVLDRIGEVVKGKPSKVFILIGINDLAHHIPDSVIIENYRRIIARIEKGSPETEIFFQTLLPTNSTFQRMWNFHNKDNDIRKINIALKELTAKEGIRFIDLYSHFVDSTGNLIKEYTWDGVHLTQKGYGEWVKILKGGHYLK